MRWLATGCMWLVGIVVIYLSNLSFFIAGGSDSLTDIAAPPLAGQVAAAILGGVAMVLSEWRAAPGGIPARSAAVTLALILLLLATHRVVIDNGLGTMRDVWLLNDIQTLAFDQRDGPAAAASLEQGALWDTVIPKDGGSRMILIRGIPPLALDMEPIEAWWTR
jgi:hypothetical protein